jgi:hypothetical protein
MNSVRLWILLLALTSFLAGLAGGLLAGRHFAPADQHRGHFADYAALLIETYDLPDDRARRLRAILDLYYLDLEELKSTHIAQGEPELIRLGETCRQRVRDYVMTDDDRRDAFDRDTTTFSYHDSLSWAAASARGD